MFMCSTLCCFFCFEYLVVHNIVKHKCLLSKTLSSLIVCFQQSMARWYLHLWGYLFYTWSSIASCSALACRSPRYSWRLHSSWKSQWLGFSISASAPHAIYIHCTEAPIIRLMQALMWFWLFLWQCCHHIITITVFIIVTAIIMVKIFVIV